MISISLCKEPVPDICSLDVKVRVFLHGAPSYENFCPVHQGKAAGAVFIVDSQSGWKVKIAWAT